MLKYRDFLYLIFYNKLPFEMISHILQFLPKKLKYTKIKKWISVNKKKQTRMRIKHFYYH